MSRSVWIILVALIVIAGSTLWLLFSDQQKLAQPAITSNGDIEELADFNYLNFKNKGTKKKQKKSEVDKDDEFNPYENELIKAQLQQVGALYAESIQYPITSQPILNAQDVRDYRPFEESEVDLPFPESDDEDNPIRVVAATNSFQYFRGDVVGIRVQIQNAPPSKFIQVQAVISGANGEVASQIDFRPSNESLTQFNAQFDTKLVPANVLSNEMLVKLAVNIDDRTLNTTVAFKMAIASAQVVGIQQVQPQGPNLVIPVQINVYQRGYYFLTAILQDAVTGKPLIQLQEERRLNRGNGIIELKAHIAALQQQGSEGPYLLRSLNMYKGAEDNEQFDAPGSSTQPQFFFQGFPFSAYENEKHVDELAEERLDFLNGVGGVDENKIPEQDPLNTQNEVNEGPE
jgi:hypothetical protein